MIEETGIVAKTDGTMATVIVQKRGACDGCVAKGTCESTPEGMEIEALNPVQAKVGQSVKIALAPRTYLKGSMLVYGLPLAVFIAGAIIGKKIGVEHFGALNSDVIAAVTGFVALTLSLVIVRLWSRKMESKAEYKPVIEEIIK